MIAAGRGRIRFFACHILGQRLLRAGVTPKRYLTMQTGLDNFFEREGTRSWVGSETGKGGKCYLGLRGAWGRRGKNN